MASSLVLKIPNDLNVSVIQNIQINAHNILSDPTWSSELKSKSPLSCLDGVSTFVGNVSVGTTVVWEHHRERV